VFRTAIIACGLVLLATGFTQADQIPGLHVTQRIDYHVTMTTKLVVPNDSSKLQQVRAWHALPTHMPWSATDSVGASAISWSPLNHGEQQFDKVHDSNHILFTRKGPFKAGDKMAFTTNFVVRSAQREFKPNEVNVDWKSFGKPSAQAQAVYAPLAAVADGIKAANSPTETVLAFCNWIATNIKYNASVPYSTDDIASIFKNKQGHCGHQFAIFNQMCLRVGIPIREVYGLNLYAPDGNGPLQKVRPDWTNIHTWAEVHFPGVGWIEVQPSGGNQAYVLQSNYIQNNRWFQNYSVTVTENGVDRQPSWSYQNATQSYVSDYGVENIIRYSTISKHVVVTGNIKLDPAAVGHPTKNGAIQVGLYRKVKSSGTIQIDSYQLWSNVAIVHLDPEKKEWRYNLTVPQVTGVTIPELFVHAKFLGGWNNTLALVNVVPVGIQGPILFSAEAKQTRDFQLQAVTGPK
jgi:hypothetical protein